MTQITVREIPPRATWTLEQGGVHPLLARLYAARGIRGMDELDTRSSALLPPQALKGAGEAAVLLADCIAAQKKILIVADYDCDGATGCAVGLRALRMMGATVDYLVPDRFTLGYGLSPEVAQLAAATAAGPGDHGGQRHRQRRRRGRTEAPRHRHADHRPPPARGCANELPDAAVIVNPNQPGCNFPSKALAGVGVMFYVMLALRAELRRRGAYADKPEPNLAGLLDLVALGTVADVVALDRNNRILVAQGLARIRGGQTQAGLAALLDCRRPRTGPTPPPSTSASPSARASTPPAVWPTCRWASSAWSPTTRPAP
jgi:single-stranded-DNA-specific exonuclease